MAITKIGRNDPCACGSGKKYKKCCQLTEKVEGIQMSPLTLQELQRAISHHQAGELSEAQVIYQKILKLTPNNADALHYLGLIYYQTGDSESAVTLISKAVTISATHLMHSNLGAALQAQGRHDLAVENYQAAIVLKADYADAYNNLGAALQEQGELAESIKTFQKALALNPNDASAQNNVGNAFLAQGNLKEALDCYRSSLKLNPDNLSTHSNLLLALSYYPQCTPQQYLDEARIFGDKVLARVKPYTYWPSFFADRKEKKLRVGFVSGDFKIHPVGYFLENILKHINPSKLELVAYSVQFKEDELTARIQPYFKQWNIISGLSDELVAQKIYDDGIDILVDLSGHTSKNRLAVFAWKAAPVQVSWLGYFASTGVPGIDFLLTDPISVSEVQRNYFSEKFWYLPETRLCFTSPDSNLTPSLLPAKHNSYVTFGCFQNLSKINDAVIKVWGEIFKALPTARLVLRNKQMSCLEEVENLRLRLSQVGIVPERVKVGCLLAREDYLASYSEVDIMLDTFPYPGGTTTCEALWMGVPTLTISGDTLLARQGASMMSCVALQSWVVEDEAQYISRAVYYAAHLEQLVDLRCKLREQVSSTALFDAVQFSKQLEEAMQGMWSYRVKESGFLN